MTIYGFILEFQISIYSQFCIYILKLFELKLLPPFFFRISIDMQSTLVSAWGYIFNVLVLTQVVLHMVDKTSFQVGIFKEKYLIFLNA